MTRKSSARRDEILRIAAEEFARNGFANVAVDEVGAAANISGPALYHHFKSKDAMLGEMLVGISEYLLSGGEAIVRTGGDDVLERLISFHANFAVDDRALITIFFRDLIHADPVDQRKVRRTQGKYVQLWVDAVLETHPNCDVAQIRSAIHVVFGLINSTPYLSDLSREATIDLLTTMASSALSDALSRPVLNSLTNSRKSRRAS